MKCPLCATAMDRTMLTPMDLKVNTDQSPENMKKRFDRFFGRATYRTETRLLCPACIIDVNKRRFDRDMKRDGRIRLISILMVSVFTLFFTILIVFMYLNSMKSF